MSDVKITVEIDGVSHDIQDCSWYFVAPCGCTHGVATVKDYDNDGWITSPEAARAQMTPNKAVREQDIALGEIVELGLRSDVMTRLKADCQHAPKWGRQQLPEGTEWGRSRGGRSAHIVDSPTDPKNFYGLWRQPKCGAKSSGFEVHPSVLGDAVMCKKCLTFAAASEVTV